MACAQRLNQPLTAAHSPPLTEELATQAAAYLTLLQESNARTNLTAIRGKEDISAATSSDTPNKPWPTLPIIILQPGIMDTTRPPQRGNPHRYRSRIRMKTPTNRRKSCTNRAQIPRIARSILAITFLQSIGYGQEQHTPPGFWPTPHRLFTP